MTRRTATMIGVVLALLASACSSGGSAANREATRLALSDVYAQLEGLEGSARTDRLIELAAAEDTRITLYTTINIDDASVILDDFEDRYGIDVDLFRASSSTVLQRVLQEADADFAGADLVAIGAAEMSALDEEELFLPLQSPYVAEIVPEAVSTNWVGIYLNVFAASWNSDRITTGATPETWEEVLTEYGDRLVLELSDYDWFAALVSDYFVGRLGYEEDEAIALFETAAASGGAIEGHSLMAELLSAGEYDISASTYQHGVERFRAKGAPLAWEPAVEPLVMRPTGIALHTTTSAPATALLFADYMLSDAQPVLAGLHRTPANRSVEGGLPPQYDVIAVDAAILGEDRERWESLYEAVIRGAARPAGQ